MANRSSGEPIVIPGGKYYTIAQIAGRRNVNISTVCYWIRKGWLPALHLPGMGYLIEEEVIAAFEVPSGPLFLRPKPPREG